MTDAFQCDQCGEYHDGRVFETLYNWIYYEGGGGDTTERVQLCEGCSHELGDGPPNLSDDHRDSMR